MPKRGKADHKTRRFYKNQPAPEPEPIPIDLEEDDPVEELGNDIDEIDEIDDAAVIDNPPPRSASRPRVKAIRPKTPLPPARHRHKRSVNFVPAIVLGVAVVAAAAFLLSGPMEKRAQFKAIAAGRASGYEAAAQITQYGPSALPALMNIIERGPDAGKLAASAGLAALLREVSTRKDALAEATAALGRGPSEGARMALAAALAQSQVEEAVEAAFALTSDPSPKVRFELARALSLSDLPASARALGALLGDDDERVATSALETSLAWSVASPELAVAAAREAVKDGQGSSSAMNAAAEVLSRARSGGAGDVAAILLKREDPMQRRAALAALAHSGSDDAEVRSAIARIISGPDDGQGLHRMALLAAAGCGADEAGPAALRIMLADRDTATRAAAARAVIATRPDGSDEAVLAVLRDASAWRAIRIAVIDAFRRSKPLSGGYQVAVVRGLRAAAANPDLTEAGLALLALESVSGVAGQGWGLDAWDGWIERRAREQEILDKSGIVLEALKELHSSGEMNADEAYRHPALLSSGARLEEALTGAGPHEQSELRSAIRKINDFRNSLRARQGR